ncbi:amino acid adenylation domain-containing protein, partial [Pseudoduganella ginsengisoli]
AKAKERGLDLAIVDLFQHPTIAALAAALAQRGDGQVQEPAAELPAISEDDAAKLPAAVEDAYPVTMLQMGMIFHNELAQGSGLYHDVFSNYLALPAWDEQALRVVLAALVRKHPVLRTGFDLRHYSEPLQLVYRDAAIPLTVTDISTLDTAAQDALIGRFIDAERQTSFDLSSAPLLRIFVHVRGPKAIQYTLSFHHAILDGWSVASLQTELFNAYFALIESGERTLELPALALTPKATATRERQALASRQQQAFWQTYLADHQHTPLPPADGPVAEEMERTRGMHVDADVAASLQSLAQTLAVPLRTVLLCAHLRVASMLDGSDDVTVGMICNVRPELADGDKVLGLFLNTLPLRQHLPRASWTDLIRQTYANELDVLAHRHYPYFQLHADNGRNPFYDITFNYTNFHVYDDLKAAPVQEGYNKAFEATGYGLDVNFNVKPGRGIHVELNTSSLSAAQTGRILGYFEAVLADIARHPDAGHHASDFLAAPERELVEHVFPATAATPAPAPQTLVQQAFEAQAASHPDTPALVFDGAIVSYGELNARANRLAHALRSSGVQPDQRVAICLPRGIDMVVSMLAVLKSGGGYVPLDPAYPAQRLAYMVDDSAPAAVITRTAQLAMLPALDVPVLALDSMETQLMELPDANPDAAAMGLHSGHLAYVIYTSGSTGQPKGVMVTHANTVHLVQGHVAATGLTGCDRVLQFASFSFDVSVGEVFPALSVGATLVMRPADMVAPDQRFLDFLDLYQVTVCDLPTAFWHQWAQDESLKQRAMPSLRLVIVGGEKAETRHLAAWMAAPGLVNCRWLNAYGPTEATVTATTIAYGRNDALPCGAIPIGRPLANTQVRILDAHLRAVPLGVAGEIYIGGAGVARGYLNRPELTAERFIDDPATPGGRLYRTGDLGRWNTDGTIAYLGRRDFQVKIRGFRIELGEIEARLAACNGVREALVVVREDQPGDKRLVAYVIAQDGASVPPSALRTELSAELADYMVPAAFVQLAAFPVTPNGKIDQKALPAPDGAAVAGRVYHAPQGPVETAIAGIWQTLLGVQQVGRDDNFFELGGHSLMVVRLIEQMRAAHLALDVGTVFAAPTVASMAAAIAGQAATGFTAPPNLIPANCSAITPDMLPLVALTQQQIGQIAATVPQGAAGIQDIYPLGPLQEGILFHHMLSPENDAYRLRSTLAFDSRSRLDAFVGALQQIISRHDILRTTIRWAGLPHAVQVVLRDTQLPVTEVALAAGGDATAQFLALTDPRQASLPLDSAPLLRATIAANPETGEWLLALLHHHIVCDHVTIELMMTELQVLMHRGAAYLAPSLPYRNFIAQTLATPATEHEAYFKRKLGDVSEPTAAFGVLNVQGDGGPLDEVHVELDAGVSAAVRDAARKAGVTPAVLFHAAMARMLAQCSGRDDVVFGSVMSGRLQGSEGVGQVLGMFINTLPIRITLEGRNARELVSETYASLRELLDHEQASLAMAQRCSGVTPPMPLFTALFNFRHSHHDTSADAGVAAESAWDGIRSLSNDERSNYPLTVNVDDFGHGFGISAQCTHGISAARVGAYLQTAMASLISALESGGDQQASLLTILPSEERLQLLGEFNGDGAAFASDHLMHQQFEAQAAARPDAVAVVCDGETLTYDQLNRRANQLAHRLMAQGVGPDSRVAICVERGIGMVVGLLAILKAGGGYVPLDPNYPADRLAYMLGDCEPAALVTQASLAGTLPATAAPVVLLDDAFQGPDHNPTVDGLAPHHLAYIIYTSGSTGMPKGVMIEHANVARLFSATDHWFGFNHTDVWTLFHSFAFDFSVWELWGALAYGGRLVVVPYAVSRSPQEFYALLSREGVTVLNQTPSAFRQLVAAQAASTLPHSLRTVVFGGEALDVAALRPWYQDSRNGATQLVNMYGITETTVHVSYRALSPADCERAGSSPIGRQIPDLQIHILDPHGQLVPIGVAGEMYVGGAGVARAYLNRPELSSQRFIADPFSQRPGARLYRTGDVARRLPDGSIDYIGRIDFQVKIRGFRIELGEIEAKLAACAGVRDAFVLVREDTPGDKRLVAYYTVNEAETTAEALRTALLQQLPDYMVPAAYV